MTPVRSLGGNYPGGTCALGLGVAEIYLSIISPHLGFAQSITFSHDSFSHDFLQSTVLEGVRTDWQPTFSARGLKVVGILKLFSNILCFVAKIIGNLRSLTFNAPLGTQKELKMVPGGLQRSSKSVPENPQGPPRDPRGAQVRPRAPPGSHSGASGSTPGPSKTYVFLKENIDFQDFTDL